MKTDIAILFVDDEKSILHALRRNLLRSQYELFFSESGREALEILSSHRVDIVVADLQMPGMDGIQLLQTVRQLYPDILRLVLSASTDIDWILDTINKGEIFRFIPKPVGNMKQLGLILGQAADQVLLFRQAREAEHLKSEFLASITHELKSPLASIKGFAETIRCNPDIDDETHTEFLRHIISESDRLAQLVTSVLDMSRIEAGYFTLDVGPTDLGLLLEEMAGSMQHDFDSANIHLNVDIPPDIPEVSADRNRVTQVFRNLLDNALKFTPTGGRVCVSLARLGQGAVVEINDTGCGIDADELPHVCERFYRGHHQKTQIGGAGLGLAVAREILDLHGWTLKIESKLGKGTTVTVTIHNMTPEAKVRDGRDDA